MCLKSNILLIIFVIVFSSDFSCLCYANSNTNTKLDENVTKANLLPNQSECGYQQPYGSPTEHHAALNEFPWVAILLFKDVLITETHGTGSLINNRYVLTAAIWVTDDKLELSKIRLGEYNIITEKDCINNECTGTLHEFNVAKKIAHPLFNRKTRQHNIALIRMSSTVDFSDAIRPICLPTPETPLPNSEDILLMSGWGFKLETSDIEEIKQRITATMISNEQCKGKVEAYGRNLFEDNFCTTQVSNETNVCAGNSGVPLMFSVGKYWYQKGMVLYGIGCSSKKIDVHINVVKYLDWIKDNLEP